MPVVVASKVGREEWYRVLSTITFANDSGTVTVFTVTGDVEVRITPICKTSLTSAAGANIRLGVVVGDDDAMIADTAATAIDANEIWVDTSPDLNIEPTSTRRDYTISNGDDIAMELDAQVDTGVIAFYCEWKPLSADGNVVAA